MPGESFTRRNLPHWYVSGAAYFVTYRLANSLSLVALERLKARRDLLLKTPPQDGVSRAEHRSRAHKLWFAEYDELLASQPSEIDLSEPRLTALIRENLYHHHGTKYRLLAYCIMPNHVHLVLQPLDAVPVASGTQPEQVAPIGERVDGVSPLAGIMHSLKSFTAHQANKTLGRRGSFWQGESYDHWIRDNDELERIVLYVQANPLQAGLVAKPQEWLGSSCYDRFRQDGEVSGWLKWPV